MPFKGRIEDRTLPRTLRHAIERCRMQKETNLHRGGTETPKTHRRGAETQGKPQEKQRRE